MFFSTKTITVEFGCNKADRPIMLAEPPADTVFDYTFMVLKLETKYIADSYAEMLCSSIVHTSSNKIIHSALEEFNQKIKKREVALHRVNGYASRIPKIFFSKS